MAGDTYPLYPNAVIVPILTFPSWILCVPPMVWHFSQHNIAAGSLILWMSVLNFFNSINAIIWPRDNVDQWWDGNILCDIEARIQVGCVVSLTACTAVIARRLAHVMDTRNITIAPSKKSRMKEKVFEIVWCWIYPAFMMITYYIVQPARYFIFGISGCVAAFDASWPSVVVTWMWAPITTFVAAYYAGLLVFRLYRYRREFHRLLAARNTTKSRFMRLFLMAIIFIICFMPYNLYILYQLSSTITDEYDWNTVHGPDWNSVIKVPSYGVVRWDRWAQIISGYVFFFMFGTGMDAHNTYKKMLCAIGLGKIFPSLYIMRESGTSTPSSVTFAKGWVSSWSSKAKTFFSKNDSIIETLPGSTHSESVRYGTPTTNRSGTLHHVPTNEPILPHDPQDASLLSNVKSGFGRIFNRRNDQDTILPIYTKSSGGQVNSFEKSLAESVTPGVHARAWASDGAAAEGSSESDGVYVVREVHQAHQSKNKAMEVELSTWD